MKKEDILKLLGLSSLESVSQIKKAYAEKSKEMHPEDDSSGFIKLRKAYKEAMQIINDEVGYRESEEEEEKEINNLTIDKATDNDSLLYKVGNGIYETLRDEFFTSFEEIINNKESNDENDLRVLLRSKFFLKYQYEQDVLEKLISKIVVKSPITKEMLQAIFDSYQFQVESNRYKSLHLLRVYCCLNETINKDKFNLLNEKNRVEKIKGDDLPKYSETFRKNGLEGIAELLDNKEGLLYRFGYEKFKFFYDKRVFIIGKYLFDHEKDTVLRFFPIEYSYQIVRLYINETSLANYLYRKGYLGTAANNTVILNKELFFKNAEVYKMLFHYRFEENKPFEYVKKIK